MEDGIIIVDNLASRAKQVFDGLDVSENTKKEYKSRIGLFISFFQGKTFTPNTYLEFKQYLAARSEFTVSTKNKYLAVCKIFLKELNRFGVIQSDITQNIKSFAQSKKHKKEGLNADEVQKFSTRIDEMPKTFKRSRLKVFFYLLAFQGFRQIEIIRLNVEDIDFQRGVAFIQGKGKDDKEIVYLHPESVKALKIYVKTVNIKSGAIFKSFGNRQSERISTRTIKREIGSIFSELAIEKTVHGFRHYFITTLLGKMDVRDVRKFSRHTNLDMLIVYDDELDMKEKAKESFTYF